jgi:transposase
MPARLPAWRIELIRHRLFDQELPLSVVLERSNICRKTLYNLRLSWTLFGQLYPPPIGKKGRPKKLNPAQEQVSLPPAILCYKPPLICPQLLFDYLSDRPTAYLDEMSWFLFDETGVVIGARAIWNCLSRGGYSRKIGRHIAKERN